MTPSLKHPGILLATWFGCGLLKPAPGSWGSLGAIPPALLIMYYLGPLGLLIATIIITLIGLWASGVYENLSNTHDNKRIVIDEVAGQWLTMIPAGLNPILVLLSFCFFRFFDITKIWPIYLIDQKVPGAAGVMGDDILAGLFAGTCIVIVHYTLIHYIGGI